MKYWKNKVPGKGNNMFKNWEDDGSRGEKDGRSQSWACPDEAGLRLWWWGLGVFLNVMGGSSQWGWWERRQHNLHLKKISPDIAWINYSGTKVEGRGQVKDSFNILANILHYLFSVALGHRNKNPKGSLSEVIAVDQLKILQLKQVVLESELPAHIIYFCPLDISSSLTNVISILCWSTSDLMTQNIG